MGNMVRKIITPYFSGILTELTGLFMKVYLLEGKHYQEQTMKPQTCVIVWEAIYPQ